VDDEPGSTLLDGLGLRALGDVTRTPLISILLPVHDPPIEILRRCLESVARQVYRRWQLCAVDDGSRNPEVSRVLEEYAAQDDRIGFQRVEANAGIAATINLAASRARGLFCGVLDHDDELSPFALFEFVRLLSHQPHADLVYCDEEKIDAEGRTVERWHKPAWNPDLALSFNYVMHFALYRTSLWRQLGGLRESAEGSQDYDLLLRASEATDRIHHIPRILYRWRLGDRSIAGDPQNKPAVFEAGIAALNDALERRGIAGAGEPAPDAWPGVYRVRRRIDRDCASTAIVVAGAGQSALHRTLGSLEARVPADLRSRLLVVVSAVADAGLSEEAARKAYAGELVWVAEEASVSLSHRMNRAAARSQGEILLFLDDQLTLASDDSFEALIEQAQRPEVGAVGGKVFYETGLLEHAGVILGPFGVCGYSHRATPDGHGYAGVNCMIGNFSAVMWRGMMTRRSVYSALAGFDESLRTAYFDVDYCLRLRQRGYLVTYTPYSRIEHAVPVARIEEMVVEPDATQLRARWGAAIEADPYFNPNFSRHREDFFLEEG
jgi:glycosyltransferase involved in cell wall biosynthesis